MPLIERGIVIDRPWIDMILDGAKDWEMRSQWTNIRGWVALIAKKERGAKQTKVVGVAQIVDVLGPLSEEEMRRQVEHHRIPLDELDMLKRYRTAWVLRCPAAAGAGPVSPSQRRGDVGETRSRSADAVEVGGVSRRVSPT